MPIDLAQCRFWLKEITYKPGYELRIVDADEKLKGRPALHLVADVIDSCFEDGRRIEVTHRRALPEQLTERDEFVAFVFDAIIGAERHEAEEWFRIDNDRLYDPHGPFSDKTNIVTVTKS